MTVRRSERVAGKRSFDEEDAVAGPSSKRTRRVSEEDAGVSLDDEDDEEDGVALPKTIDKGGDVGFEVSGGESDSEDDDEVVETTSKSKPSKKGKGKQAVMAATPSEKRQRKLNEFLREHPEHKELGLVPAPANSMHLALFADLDIFDPETYEVIDMGNGKHGTWQGRPLSANPWAGFDGHYNACWHNFHNSLRNEIVGRQGQLADGSGWVAFNPSDASALNNHDAESLVNMVMLGMALNTIGVMGRYRFQEADMKDMNGFDKADLDGPISYGIFFFRGDAAELKKAPPPKKYMGKGAAENGSGVRIGGDYEKGLQRARDGVATSKLYGNTVVQQGALPGVRVYARPLYKPNLNDGISDMTDANKVGFVEGVMTDLEESLVGDGQVKWAKWGSNNPKLLNSPEIEQLANDVAPVHRGKRTWEGLNKAHPFAQGYELNGPTELQKKIEPYEDADGKAICPVCERANMNAMKNIDTRDATQINLKDELPWFTVEVCCRKCHIWLTGFSGKVHGPARAAKEQSQSMEDLVKHRQASLNAPDHNIGSRPRSVAKRAAIAAAGDNCPLCDVAFEFQGASETRAQAHTRLRSGKKHQNLAESVPPDASKLPYFNDVERVCARCKILLHNIHKRETKADQKAQLKVCVSLEAAKALFAEWYPRD